MIDSSCRRPGTTRAVRLFCTRESIDGCQCQAGKQRNLHAHNETNRKFPTQFCGEGQGQPIPVFIREAEDKTHICRWSLLKMYPEYILLTAIDHQPSATKGEPTCGLSPNDCHRPRRTPLVKGVGLVKASRITSCSALQTERPAHRNLPASRTGVVSSAEQMRLGLQTTHRFVEARK